MWSFEYEANRAKRWIDEQIWMIKRKNRHEMKTQLTFNNGAADVSQNL